MRIKRTQIKSREETDSEVEGSQGRHSGNVSARERNKTQLDIRHKGAEIELPENFARENKAIEKLKKCGNLSGSGQSGKDIQNREKSR
jgi:hypothetical protein